MGPAFVIGFIVLSFVFSFWLGRRILRGASKSAVLESGTPTTAVITSMQETGTTVNEHPMVEFGLRVDRPGGGTYDATVKQLLPRLLTGAVLPGRTVAVKVMPDDPRAIGIDWQSVTAGGGTGGAAGTVPEGMLAGVGVGETVDTDEFLLRALPARGEIDGMSETGITATNPRTGEVREAFAFALTVHQDGQPDYETKCIQAVPDEWRGRIGPGAVVPIGINPDDPNDVAVNWHEHEREQRGS